MNKETIKQGKELLESAKELSPNEQVVDKISELAIVLTDQLTALAPQALEVLLAIKQIDSISTLSKSFFLMLTTGVVIFYLIKFFRWRNKEGAKPENKYDWCWSFGQMASAFAIALFIIGGVGFLHLWTWVGVFAPELAIAKDIYDSVVN